MTTGRVVIASTRAAAAVYEDRTGPPIVEWLSSRGVDTPDPVVVPDGDPVEAALRAAVATDSALGSALPMSSEASTTMRRAMKRGSSPASTITAR